MHICVCVCLLMIDIDIYTRHSEALPKQSSNLGSMKSSEFFSTTSYILHKFHSLNLGNISARKKSKMA